MEKTTIVAGEISQVNNYFQRDDNYLTVYAVSKIISNEKTYYSEYEHVILFECFLTPTFKSVDRKLVKFYSMKIICLV